MKEYKIPPNPGSILGSLRSIGYNLKTALSDIIDNSIAAEAKRIEIVNSNLEEDEAQLKWIAIVDDGQGMTKDEMLKALTLGGEGIELERNPEDLGRFGLGLKTASVSQCRKLTLISKSKNNEIHTLVFDLDHIMNIGWEVYAIENSSQLINTIKKRVEDTTIFDNQSWTVVYWENLDKIKTASVASFYAELSKVKNHFELIYHKFKDSVHIRLNGTLVNYWDPYKTAVSSQEKQYKYSKYADTYSIKGHVLKHSSEFESTQAYENQSLIGTFNQNQGFFIYRNKRLIYRGSWLGLFNKEHHYILARIEINLTNKLESDLAWGVNISKSSVSIPRFAEADIRAECNRIRSEANNTFRFHGGVRKHTIRNKSADTEIQPIWNFESKGSKIGEKNQYRINTKHPLFESYLKKVGADAEGKKEFKHLLRYLENYLPIDNIFARRASNEVEQPVEEEDILHENFKELLETYKLKMDVHKAFTKLTRIEPYNSLSFDEDRLSEIGVDYNRL